MQVFSVLPMSHAIACFRVTLTVVIIFMTTGIACGDVIEFSLFCEILWIVGLNCSEIIDRLLNPEKHAEKNNKKINKFAERNKTPTINFDFLMARGNNLKSLA